ncbi:MAG: cation/H(+) antiporter [Polyangiaceae bacterium]
MAAWLVDPLARFIAQAALIVVVSRALGVFTRWLGQPMVIAEISAGILLGPSLVGWLWPGFTSAVFPTQSLPLLGLASQVGLLLFMFLIGIELDPKLLRGRANASIAISQTSIVLPFALGALLALYLFQRFAPAGVQLSSFMLFMGVAMSITAFPVLARILVERQLLGSRVGAVTIACAAVDDVTAWCILAFVVSTVRSTSAAGAVRTVLLALGYIALMLLVVRPLLQRLADRTKLGLGQNLVAVILVGVLASSFITEQIGIHALFGAFLFGAILPKQGSFSAALAEKLEDLVVVLLLPLFFAYSGLRTQIGLLDTGQAWLVCGLVIVVACVGKFGGAFAAARLTGSSWREAGAIGILMNTRGLMELVVVNIGLDLGVLSPTLFTMMVLMALVTTFITTPLLRIVYPVHALTRELVQRDLEPIAVAEATAGRPGFTVLVCVAFERSGTGLVSVARAIAGDRTQGSLVYALRLVPPHDRSSFILEQNRAMTTLPDDEAVLGPAVERGRGLQIDVRPLSFVSNAPAKDICRVAEVKAADLVLLGWHKPLVGSAMLGGTVHDVMTQARTDVAVLVDRGLERVTRVLVPYLGSERESAVLSLSQRIAEHSAAEVTVLHVAAPGAGASGDLAQQAVLRHFPGREPKFLAVSSAAPAEAVIEESARGYDLVLIAADEEWGLTHRSFALEPEAILERASASVLVVHQYQDVPVPVTNKTESEALALRAETKGT